MKRILSLILFAATSMALDLPDKQMQKTNSLQLTGETRQESRQSPFWQANCFDLYDTKECKKLQEKWGFCKFAKENQMEKLCRKTCGLCGPKFGCSKTKYKCCPDGVTPKTDEKGSNCPECKDKHPELCQKYSNDCNDVGWAGQWMYSNCRLTCQICKAPKAACKDDEHQKEFCPKWKKFGMCDLSGSLMKKYCPATCGFCEIGQTETERLAPSPQNDRGSEKKKV
ncbi:zinc metalloproteinase nas-14-like [Rhopilema esculentum]|uniref:zinc metalloproteinase nas-14-like n=1 Tax=Rhopilema esculentum TaxID=499914 RepID=UPI0031DB3F5B